VDPLAIGFGLGLLPSSMRGPALVGRGDILHFFEVALWFGLACCVLLAGMGRDAADRRTA
jgi:hypothetical protein